MVEFFATVINSFNDDTVRVFTTPASEVTISTELLEAGSALNVTVLFADKVVNAAVDGVVAPIGELFTEPATIVRSLFTCVSVKPLPMRTAFTVVVPLFVDAINASP
jgi:phage shock protein PspC (stress-responsive transcriptional regulator)